MEDRALDRSIAELVMGWTAIGPIASTLVGFDPVCRGNRCVPAYSSSIRDAEIVLEAFEARGFSTAVYFDPEKLNADLRFECRLWHEKLTRERAMGNAETRCMAICRAAQKSAPTS